MKNKISMDLNLRKGTISRYLHGHFAEHLGRCIYGGLWVGQDSPVENTDGIRTDVLEALKKINVPVIRWPGGCFADEYHWKDGIGHSRKRRKSINTHWGMVTETHAFGTHEFLRLCELLGCDAYIAGNLGSGTVREMQEWVEYITCGNVSSMSDLRKQNGRTEPWSLDFFGIGNENWACGGNMRPEYYADLYRQYQTYIKSYPGNHIQKIACGPNSADYNWTEILMKNTRGIEMYGLSLHYYTLLHNDWHNMGHATEFDREEWFDILKNSFFMDELITKHSLIMDRYDPDKKIALVVDEWGTWYKAQAGANKKFLFQQNTIRDALSASIHLNIFHKHNERVKMANIAQLVNVLQAPILIDGDVMIKTPTYHVFDLYQDHQENTFVPLEETVEEYEGLPMIYSTASYDEAKAVLVLSLSNLHPEEATDVVIQASLPLDQTRIRGRILQGKSITSHNTKNNTEEACLQNFSTFKQEGSGIHITLPSKSVCTLVCKI
ncbi:MAG: alpha-L-arabinofuranosidase C-terminal domain-containing protein [Clostridia bacterium]